MGGVGALVIANAVLRYLADRIAARLRNETELSHGDDEKVGACWTAGISDGRIPSYSRHHVSWVRSYGLCAHAAKPTAWRRAATSALCDARHAISCLRPSRRSSVALKPISALAFLGQPMRLRTRVAWLRGA